MTVRAFILLKLARRFICCLLWVHVTSMAQTPSTATAQERPGNLTWIERPWSMRTFIHVEPHGDWIISKEVSKEENLKRASREPKRRFFTWEELFDPDHVMKLKVPDLDGNTNLAVIVMSFDQDGMVTSTHSRGKPLRGRINRLRDLGLSDGEGLEDRFYYMADWFTGIGDASTHWAPAYCNQYQSPHPLTLKSDSYLYGKLFKPYSFTPLFGCREWAYQLYDSERPYIDVTSYELGARGKPTKGHIREFMGWARFGDSKPVIGQHQGDWYCLHDCPGGDAPGLIPDIKAWAKRFDWHAPVPPTRVPTFPDPPAKSGTYPYEPKPLYAPAASSPKLRLKKEAEHNKDDPEFPDVPADVGC